MRLHTGIFSVSGAFRWRTQSDNAGHLHDRVNRNGRMFFENADLNDRMSLILVLLIFRPD